MPQEEVIVEIIKQTRTYSRREITTSSKTIKDRVTPKCRSYDNCQGCTMLHLSYFKQLNAKKEAVRESIRKYTEYDLSEQFLKM